MAEWIKAAKKKDAAIICFPELNINGYSNRKAIFNTAESIPGPISRELSQWSALEDMVILAGMAEKDQEGRMYASHLIVKPDEGAGVYRKLHVAPPERSLFTAGSTVPLFEACGVKFGIQLCYDAHFPELSTIMALKGADVIFMPHASPRGTPKEKYNSWMRHLPARAYDNGVFILACNQTAENENGLTFPGIAVALGPSGEIIALNLDGKEGMLIVDLKADDLARIRNHEMRYFLPNRRAGIYETKA
jgi:N-carbamoylputrescine amidase